MKKLLTAILLLVFTNPTWSADTPDPAALNLVLVRHGHYLADAEADKALGPGLSPIGVAQARLTAARLRGLPVAFDALYVSPLQRARDTAAVIGEEFSGRGFSVLADLEECTPPTRRSEVTKEEKPDDLAACKAQFDRLFDAQFRPASGVERTHMLVCHGNVIRYMVTRALGVDSMAWLEMSFGHTSITRIRVEADGRFKLISAGDVGHLPPNLLTGATGDSEKSLAIPALREAR